MNKLLLVLILSIFLNAGEFTKIYVNKNHSLLTFVESLNGTSYVSDKPKWLYLKSFERSSIKELLRWHKTVSRSRIYNYKGTKSLLEALYMESIKHEKFEDFRDAILSYKTSLGKQRLKKYFSEMDDISYIYEKIIWDKNHKKLNYKKHQLEKIMKKGNYDNLILTLAKFYGVKKEDIGVMHIPLYAIPSKSNIRAYSIKNIETVGIYPSGRKNLKWLLSATILHEISHTLYAKSKFVKKSFKTIKDKQKRILVNEVFATAIGAGWGYEKLSGKSSKNFQWYNNKEYNRLAKKLYPMLKVYLNEQKQIDKKLEKFIKKETL